MKIKLISFLVIGVFIGGFFSSANLVKASTLDAEGCLPNQNYSSTTGQRCGCSHNEIYSSTTGLLCIRDSQVTGFLSEQGPSFTMWGTHRITNDEFAVCVTTPCPLAVSSYLVSAGDSSSVLSDLKRYENSKVKIIGRLQWYNIEGGFWGIIATNVIPVNMNQETIRVISPNGGETIRIGQKYNIIWDSNRIPSNSDISISLKYYDITCGPAPMVGCQTQFYIDTVKNTGSYLWDTNKKMSGASTGPNSVSVVAGQKYVIELISSSGTKDVSDNYFTFVSSQINTPVISGISGPQNLDVNQTGTWKVTATDSSGGDLSYSVNWGDNNYREVNSIGLSINQSEQTATFTHIYLVSGVYNPVFTVTNQNGVSAQTSLTVNVGNSIYPPGCTSNIGYSTLTGINCGVRECRAPGSVCDPNSLTPYKFERTLKIGNKGIDVQHLQTFLGLTVDGSFGPMTRARVMEWQRANGLTPDGVFGPASRLRANMN
jgi:peptidoglycan hydrolase-like protein with peptidoglycan-binding domain